MNAGSPVRIPVFRAHRATFRAFVETVVPYAASLDAAAWRDVEAIAEAALENRPERLQRQLSLFLRIIDTLPLLRYGRRFARLDPEARTRFLRMFQDSRLLLVRRGFWGLRTLALMGYYARPAAADEIGYRASTAGWDAR